MAPAERNYPTHKLEFLALKWAVVDKLRNYLYGAEFIIKTDNNLLTYLLTTAKLDATGHRWLAALSGFTFSLKYQPGVGNKDADALSRRPHCSQDSPEEWTQLTPEGVRALCEGAEQQEVGPELRKLECRLLGCPDAIATSPKSEMKVCQSFLKRICVRTSWKTLCSLALKALESKRPDLLLADSLKKAVYYTESGIGCSYNKGWSTEVAPLKILKRNGSCSYQKNIERRC